MLTSDRNGIRGLSEARNDSELYYEIRQEYPHATNSHWQSDRRSYSNFDLNGDWRDVISITVKEEGRGVSLVSFLREELEEYLAASDYVLVRMYEFLLVNMTDFNGWPDVPEEVTVLDSRHAYRRLTIPGKATWTNGVQLIRPSRDEQEIFDSIRKIGRTDQNPKYIKFTILDWRNRRLASVSTDPSESTNYFEASQNSLPYEVSPAFFKPEVLQKYKADKDKYTIKEGSRSISCRGSWYMKSYDVNEAGQVHVYLVYLRDLPYSEQLHWLSYNEEPNANISERAFKNDIKAEFSGKGPALVPVVSIARRWSDSDLEWWKLPDSRLLERVTTPITDNREEWSQSFLELAKLLVEGFRVKPLRRILRKLNVPYDKDMKSLALLELILSSRGETTERLVGLREVWNLRNLTIAHAGATHADELSEKAMRDHGTYRAHFESVCITVLRELESIERSLHEFTSDADDENASDTHS